MGYGYPSSVSPVAQYTVSDPDLEIRGRDSGHPDP